MPESLMSIHQRNPRATRMGFLGAHLADSRSPAPTLQLDAPKRESDHEYRQRVGLVLFLRTELVDVRALVGNLGLLRLIGGGTGLAHRSRLRAGMALRDRLRLGSGGRRLRWTCDE